ncbi:MAG: efflux RND transporter periplasmic adaptor subunit [Nitrospiraceae bacterium]|nr:efflux RND transporter periplasmic adaptor subunit [Nitrospiraceae bacterium]
MKRYGWKLTVGVLCLAAAGAALWGYPRWRSSGAARAFASVEESGGAERRVPVVLTPVLPRTFEERVVVQGNIEARTSATVSARIPGPVERIFVDEGDTVVAGETKLFQSDSLKLSRALDISRQDLAVARCGLREKEANLERVQADLAKAEIDIRRFEKLHEDKAVSSNALEEQQSRYKQTSAMLKHAMSLVDLGKEQVGQAETGIAIAQKNLQDALVVAPVTGSVSVRFLDPGETAGVGDPVVRIEDPSVVEVSAYLPAQYYPRIVIGDTRIRMRVYGVEVGEHVVTYKAPTIHPKLRTFEVKSVVKNPPEGVVPGAMAQIEVLLDKREGLGVPARALQTRAGRQIVFVVEDGRARMLAVETALETDGWVELSGDALSEGTRVVTQGQFLLKDGTAVAVRDAAAPESADRAGEDV